jgi:hypothetical protein
VVIVGVDFIEGGVHNGLDRIEGVQDLLARFQVPLCSVQVVESLLDIGDVCKGIDVCFLCVGLVHLFGEGCEERESFLVICSGKRFSTAT